MFEWGRQVALYRVHFATKLLFEGHTFLTFLPWHFQIFLSGGWSTFLLLWVFTSLHTSTILINYIMRKQLDPRIPALIANGVKANHRSFFVMVGDRGRDQVVNLHFLLSQTRVSSRPNVLWCYKKDLGFTTWALRLMLVWTYLEANIVVIVRSEKPRSSEMLSEESENRMSKIHSSSL